MSATIKEMENFPAFIEKLEKDFRFWGVVKVIPPQGWKNLMNFTENSTQFDQKLVMPKYQVCKYLDNNGIYQLGNNLQSDRCFRKPKPKMKGKRSKQNPIKNIMPLGVKLNTNFINFFLVFLQIVCLCSFLHKR